MKIKNINKFIRGILIIIAIIFIALLFLNDRTYSYNTSEYISIYARKGDTLWSIACDLQNTDYYNKKDIRYIINDIKKINNLMNSNLIEGDELKIPVL